ncbi:uncharacterized protein TNCV_4071701 [Trichonephila clavipes]|uniref:Uncharacterized protein n=1 Tax=Trichonephila clavipes TaxID=2585209 RepID=A0A8X6W7Q0_TRICX|nr:uncharacterized protein TNCV_4071701 [Trichonephila clavipes]
MSATQETRNLDLSSSNAIYLPTSADEPELNSINFQQSLRFFQEPLILNSTEFASRSINNDISNQFEIPFLDENNPIKRQLHIDQSYDEMPLNSNKISIPTVDTILESVRVLRAIQKSQEQRGSLNISPTESKQDSLSFENFEHEETSQITKDFLSFPKDTKSLGEIESQEIIYSVTSNETECFWSSHQIVANACHNDAFLMKQHRTGIDHDPNEPISLLSHKKQDDIYELLKKDSENTNKKNSNDVSEVIGCETVQEKAFQTNTQRFSKDYRYATISSTSNTTTSDPSYWDLDCVGTTVSCSCAESSKCLKDDGISNNSYDNAQHDDSTELTKETNKTGNLISSSSHPLRPESRSDSCSSSYYVSAECSPCVSLHGDFEHHRDENYQRILRSPQFDLRIPLVQRYEVDDLQADIRIFSSMHNG